MRVGSLRAAVLGAAVLAAVPWTGVAGDGRALACRGGGGGHSTVSRPQQYQALPGELTNLPSDHDGAQIQIGVIRPDTAARVPVIVLASPYFYGGVAGDDMRRCAPRLSENFVPQGYAVAFVPVRGTADTGGCFDLMGTRERTDLNQAITWLGTRSWSNGNVAMIGLSYDGSTPWEVASLGNPHLRTIVPISGVNDIYHLMFRNGSNELRGPGALNALYYTYGFQQYNPTSGRSPEHTVSGVVCPESWKGLAAAAYSGVTGERDPMAFWEERNSRPGVEEHYRGSVLMVQGLQDWNVDPGHQFPWINELEARGTYVRYLLGQWAHAYPDTGGARSDWADMLLDWFDHWLKGDTTVDLGPRVEVQDSGYAWRTESNWPPADAQATSFYLTADGGLSPTPSAAEGERALVPGSSFLPCPPCARFESAPLSTDFRFAGIPVITLRVVPSGPGGHVKAALYDSENFDTLGWGQVDLRFANGGELGQVVVPGQPMIVRLPLEPLDVLVPAGRKMILVLGQEWYGDHIPSVPTYPVVLQLGGTKSALTVGSFERTTS